MSGLKDTTFFLSSSFYSSFTYIKGLAFVLDLCYTIHMSDRPTVPVETAEERATRMWRNNEITRKLKSDPKAMDHHQTILDEKANERDIAFKIKKYALEIFNTNKQSKIAMYRAALKHQRRRLLLEKLKRLERDNAE
jgi:hypothetical protein